MNLRISSRAARGIGLLFIDGVFFGATDPLKVPSLYLVAACLLLAATSYWIISGLLRFPAMYGFQLKHHRRRLSLTVTAVATGLMALQSVSQLSTRDVVVVLPLAAIAYMYYSYQHGPAVSPAES